MLKLLRQIKFIQVFWIFFYFFLFCLLLRGSLNYLDPDLGWHLKVGQEISQTGAVPHLNHYNYTFNGNWVDHEWLSNFLVYQIYNNWGYPALTILFALLVIFVFIGLHITVRKLWPDRNLGFLVAIIQLWGLIAALPHFGVRIQELAAIFLGLVLLIIYQYNQTKNWRWLLIFLPLFYLWSCLHASFLVGFFIVFSWLGIRVLEKILVRFTKLTWIDYSQSLEMKELTIFLGLSILAVFITFFTPYKTELYSFLSGYSNTFYLAHIQEWLSQFSYPFFYWQLTYLSLVFLALLIYFQEIKHKERRLRIWPLFLTIVFFILSFKSRRHFPLLLVSSFVFLIDVYSGAMSAKVIKIATWLKAYLLFCLLLAISSQLVQIKFITNPFQAFSASYPYRAVEFLKTRPEYARLNILNDYVWGGYLIWQAPTIKPFIDGRLPQVAYKNRTFLEEYLDFFDRTSNYRAKLEEYNVKLVLIKPNEKQPNPKNWEKILFGLKNNPDNTNYLKAYLDASRDWQVIFQDKASVLYLKQN